MTDTELAHLAAAHAEHCSHKCCGNGPWSHHPEGNERLCPMAAVLAEVARLRTVLRKIARTATQSGDTAFGGRLCHQIEQMARAALAE